MYKIVTYYGYVRQAQYLIMLISNNINKWICYANYKIYYIYRISLSDIIQLRNIYAISSYKLRKR